MLLIIMCSLCKRGIHHGMATFMRFQYLLEWYGHKSVMLAILLKRYIVFVTTIYAYFKPIYSISY